MLDWEPLILTFRLALVTTLLLLLLSIPLAYWLAYSKARIKPVVETLVSMPLVLPPTVLGFYLLVAFSPANSFGGWLDDWLGIQLVFSFEGLVVASIIYSLPFMVHPIQSGFANLPTSLVEAAYVLGKSPATTLFKVLLPNIKPSLLTGIVLAFAHTVGEFGVVLMIGGNMPGKTKVASIAIYDEVESLNYAAANSYSLILFAVTFVILLVVYLVNGGYLKKILEMIELQVQKKLRSAAGEMTLDLQLELEPGKLIALYGKSGAGKTSLLRILAGLLAPEEGRIVVGGTTWLDTAKGISLPPQKRKVGLVFQDYALFPNMSVKENLLFALEKGQDRKIVADLIEIVELGALQDRKPDTLSGGQRQRVALARALVQRPQLLLLDEPLSALDHEMRVKLQQHILQVHREFGLTTLLISHDIAEILKMADHLLEIDHGRIVRQGTPAEVFAYQELSGKFQFTGEIVGLDKQDFLVILAILVGSELVKVVVDEDEAKELSLGNKVVVASKAFNPVIRRIG